MGLRRVILRDFVIVRHLELDIASGFTALTGETGAGKSILVDALQLVLGGRGDASVVREGASRCEISAEFDRPDDLLPWLEDNGLADTADEPSLLLRRAIDAQGRSRAWVNGTPATLAQLKHLGDRLVDIHGQHAWQSLTRPDAVRRLLDGYAGLDTTALAAQWRTWRDAQRALHTAQSQQAQWQDQRERLLWQIAEVDKLAPQPGEWEELNRAHGRLANAQGLMEAAQQALQALDADDNGARRQLHRAAQALRNLQDAEPRFAELAELIDSAETQLQDACRDLQHHAEATELDPEALGQLDQRLGLWLSLARRHRCPPEELTARLAEWRQACEALERDSDLDGLARAEAVALRDLRRLAQGVSQRRQKAAQALSAAITEAMQGLGMAGGRFEVRLTALDEVQAHGLDQVEFLVAGHPGSTPRLVAKVASGGELSRIALAISVTTSRIGQAPTLIFDEVDAGIGGAVAQTVGRLMRQLGQDRQVLAVTHLPQVAASANAHLRVAKHQDAAGTHSQVQALEMAERVLELARMLGGEPASEASIAHAREMLQP